jgi:hypothetical protein
MKRPDKTLQIYSPLAAAQMGRAVGDFTADMERYADALEKRIKKLENALWALCHEKGRYYPDGCWCEACHNNPMCPDHTGACKMAQKAMREVRDGVHETPKTDSEAAHGRK